MDFNAILETIRMYVCMYVSIYGRNLQYDFKFYLGNQKTS